MRRICLVACILFLIAYLLALLALAIGTFGSSGQECDPLSGIFPIPLGPPWNLFLDGLPKPIVPWLGVLAASLNLLLISVICGVLGKTGRKSR
jgi:hypothetical protein